MLIYIYFLIWYFHYNLDCIDERGSVGYHYDIRWGFDQWLGLR